MKWKEARDQSRKAGRRDGRASLERVVAAREKEEQRTTLHHNIN